MNSVVSSGHHQMALPGADSDGGRDREWAGAKRSSDVVILRNLTERGLYLGLERMYINDPEMYDNYHV